MSIARHSTQRPLRQGNDQHHCRLIHSAPLATHVTIWFLLIAGIVFISIPVGRADDVQSPATNSGSQTKSADNPADTNSAKSNAPPKENLGQRKESTVGQNEELSFRESKVAAEMTELEERMYRLSEALKRIEPENSSRLMSGVKYARDELILHEMQEIQDILNRSDYKLASGEQKEMLVKLQRLEQLLLSTDLDLQLQLQRLRLMRDILHRLDTAIAEEDREQKQSATSTAQDKRLQNLPRLREKLEELIR